jgi:hypothetical protein
MTEVLNEMTQTISKMTKVLGRKDWRNRSEEHRWFGRLCGRDDGRDGGRDDGRDGGTRPLKRPAHLPVQISSGVSVA